ncbi:hypothetical protein BaRGS_00031987 [Batillaria attramentaria]|uniref:Uncharacterized protein n=1 Tax=Batillaria attramentaria TaxID=370345 RepID=A0ABD0JQ18_9CAEN
MGELDFLEFIAPVVGFTLYVIAFASKCWVNTEDDFHWGLWQKCIPANASSNLTDEECEYMSVGESDGYYEAVRTLSCFVLVCHIFGGLATFRDRKKPEEWPHPQPTVLAIATVIMTVIVLAVMGGSYKNDSRWQTRQPSLGWCYWLALGSACAWAVAVHFLYKGGLRQMQALADATAAATASSTQVVTSTAEGEETRSVASSLSEGNCAGGGDSQGASAASDAGKGAAQQSRQNLSAPDLYPVLSLPSYESAAFGRGAVPVIGVPPPAYEDVMRQPYSYSRQLHADTPGGASVESATAEDIEMVDSSVTQA